ncbi:MAG: efflux RND transporter periplasmic adaptor subunit [Legionellaceae bacterium]|nr:efflux RND transporter periplasmic adaptor subunit [Legionellaceae bacterium]
MIRKTIFLIGWLLFFQNIAFATTPSPHFVTLSAGSIKAAGVHVTEILPHTIEKLVKAPGEVVSNANASTKVTTRVPAEVLKRYVNEGDVVQKSALLASLSSVDIAKIQAALILANKELKRVESLGRDAVSAKRFTEAEVGFRQANSIALSYGMTNTDIQALLNEQTTDNTKGEFKLYAAQSGIISGLNFIDGELISPGQILLQIVNEQMVWVDAKLPPNLAHSVKVGDIGWISSGENKRLKGTVIQLHPRLDPVTRTRVIRLQVKNPEHSLQPGQFVQVDLVLETIKNAIALPLEAVIKTSEGRWVVYVEKSPMYFEQVEVNVVKNIGDKMLVEGLAPQLRVVTKGAFFVYSELNKQKFEPQS